MSKSNSKLQRSKEKNNGPNKAKRNPQAKQKPHRKSQLKKTAVTLRKMLMEYYQIQRKTKRTCDSKLNMKILKTTQMILNFKPILYFCRTIQILQTNYLLMHLRTRISSQTESSHQTHTVLKTTLFNPMKRTEAIRVQVEG